jgi:hypothetical protein
MQTVLILWHRKSALSRKRRERLPREGVPKSRLGHHRLLHRRCLHLLFRRCPHLPSPEPDSRNWKNRCPTRCKARDSALDVQEQFELPCVLLKGRKRTEIRQVVYLVSFVLSVLFVYIISLAFSKDRTFGGFGSHKQYNFDICRNTQSFQQKLGVHEHLLDPTGSIFHYFPRLALHKVKFRMISVD